MESISVTIPTIHSSGKRFDRDSSPPEHASMTGNMMNIDTPEANDGARRSEDCGSISNLPRTPKSGDHLGGNHSIDNGNGATSLFSCEQCSRTLPSERGLLSHRGWHKRSKHFKPVSASDVPGKRKRERSTANASTISDVVQASDSDKQSLAFSIHRRDLTEEEKRILKTFLWVNREQRHIEMPGCFDASSGYIKPRWRNVIRPLVTRLRKSCDACQQGILICETDPNGSCVACMMSGKDCSFLEPKQTRVYGSQANSSRRKEMSLSREKSTDDGTADQEYVPNPKLTSMGKRRLSENVQKMKTKSVKPSESNSFSRKGPSTQVISTPLAEENGPRSMFCEDELQSDFAAPAAHLRPSQQDRNTSVLPLDKSMQTLFGREVLDDEQLVDLFKILASTIGQYHCATNNARYLDDVQRTSFLRVPLEELESSSPKHKLIESLREILVVPQGIDVYQQARSLGIQNIDQSDLVQAVLAICVRDMIFGGNSPFSDETLWREELQHSFGLKVANMVLQSRRIRMSNESAFQETMRKRSEVHVWRMNQLMFPLVGGTAHNHEKLHRRLANRTTDIHTKIHAFSGIWISIWAGFGAAFNSTFHTPERLNHNESLTNRQVLMTVCPGIRRQLQNGDWFPCVKARVILLDVRPPE